MNFEWCTKLFYNTVVVLKYLMQINVINNRIYYINEYRQTSNLAPEFAKLFFMARREMTSSAELSYNHR